MYSIFCCSLFENIDPPVFGRLSSRMHLSLFPLPSRLSIDNNNTMNFILDSFLFICAIILIYLTNYCKVSLLPAMNSSGNWCRSSMNLYLHKIFWGVRYKGVDKINFNHSVVLFIRQDGLQWLRSLWNNKSTFFRSHPISFSLCTVYQMETVPPPAVVAHFSIFWCFRVCSLENRDTLEISS